MAGLHARSQAPWQARAASFAAVASALGACMATRYRLFHEALWREAAAVWPSVLAAGLPAVRQLPCFLHAPARAARARSGQRPPYSPRSGVMVLRGWYCAGMSTCAFTPGMRDDTSAVPQLACLLHTIRVCLVSQTENRHGRLLCTCDNRWRRCAGTPGTGGGRGRARGRGRRGLAGAGARV